MITLVVQLQGLPGRAEEIEQVFTKLAGEIRSKEPDCVSFSFARGAEPDTYVVVETYASQEALDFHSASAHLQVARQIFAPLMAEPSKIAFNQTIAHSSRDFARG